LLSTCPNCKSSFEIDEQQAKAADGLVRCGACLQVFNCKTSREQAEPKPDTTAQEFIGIDLELEAIEAQIQAIAQKRPLKKDFAKSAHTTRSIDDELSDFSSIFDTIPPAQPKTQLNVLPQEFESYDVAKGKPEAFPLADDGSNDWNEEETTQLAPPTTQGLKRRSKIEEDIEDFFAGSDTIQHQGSGAQQYKTTSLRPSADQGFTSKKTAPLTSVAIDDEPLNIDTTPENNTKPRLWMWSIGIVIILCALPILYLVSEFQTLSQDPKWRPKLAFLCNIVQCTLPVTYSTQYLKVTSLTTSASGYVLEVNAVIFNTNPHFDMPFPNLRMQFTDINDNVLADLDITPDEYRQGEIARLKLFPSNTSAHITFLIPSPGEDGINYTMTFEYPDNVDSMLDQ